MAPAPKRPERKKTLTGVWAGHYVQEGAKHGITMQVTQRGASFRGTMRDADTLTIGEMQHDADAEPRTRHDAGEIVSSLPEESSIEGTVTGDRIAFTKVYRGTHTIEMWTADSSVRIEVTDHTVLYEGRISRAGDRITGSWRIEDLGLGEEIEEGAFVLERASAATR